MTITLNEEKARLWLALNADAVAEGEDYEVDINESWDPRAPGQEQTAVDLVWEAQQEDAAVFEGLGGREINLLFDDDGDGGGYFFMVDFPSEPLHLRIAFPLCTEWRRIGTRDAVGIDAAIGVLEEAVQAANFVTDQLSKYTEDNKEEISNG